ncbi:MAG TPA: hypothetical protein VE673_14580 [Pseudonocardiaceae bacterium]|nr:hypothetical protein [Pseudonocardiaceae bacterium]
MITRHIDDHDGDIAAGITSAARRIAANLPISAITMILATPNDLFSLRYPDTHNLFVLHRAAGGPHGQRPGWENDTMAWAALTGPIPGRVSGPGARSLTIVAS